MREDIAIGVIDVGSPASGSIGWAIHSPDLTELRCGGDLDEFIDIVGDVALRYPTAIGFEAPLYAPYRGTAISVLKARSGEGARPWSAGAGASVTTAALGVVPYVLREMRLGLPGATAHVGEKIPTTANAIYFFEAFVSAAAKGKDHQEDATIALEAFRTRLRDDPPVSDLGETEVFSLLGAALLRTGWSDDIALLEIPCLVVKA
jgi:hypothetical protein